MITAEEVLIAHRGSFVNHGEIEAMIEFATICCIEQARVISEKAELETIYDNPVNPSMGSYEVVDKESILNAFDLDSIK